MDTPIKDVKTPNKKKIFPQSPQTPQTPSVDSSVKRRVSDVLVTIHKCIQTWDVDNQASFNTANTLCNLYSQWGSVEDCDLPEINDICKRKYYVKLAATREDLLEQLKHQRQKLNILIKKMTGLVDNLKAIYYLGLVSDSFSDTANSTINDSIRDENGPAIFSTWTADQFYRTTKLILNMYSKEYLLKDQFYEHFFNYRVKEKSENDEGTNVLNQCMSVWLHQPFLENKCKFMLDSMLVEADLK